MKKKHKISTILTFSIFFLLLCLIPLGIITNNFPAFNFGIKEMPIFRLIFATTFFALVGTLVSKLISKNSIKTIEEIKDATKEIANGNYNVRIEEKSTLLELNDMAHNFNLMAKDLAQTHMMNNDFIGNVSHEFKTPLSAIDGYASLLINKKNSPEKVEEYAKSILFNSRRLSKMTGNILLLSTLDNSTILLNKKKFLLSEQIREIILVFESQWTEKNIDLDIDLEEIDFIADMDLLSHVWQNLFSNAIKFCNADGKIKVTLKSNEGKIKFSISNTGTFIKGSDTERIFEKFYQTDTSRSSQGNGLGLSIVKKIVDLHHGEIKVFSEENEMTSFIVTI